MFIKNDPLLSWNFSNLTIWSGDMRQELHFFKHMCLIGRLTMEFVI